MTLEIARSRRIADAGVLSCMVQYGRQTTDGFQQANCSEPLKRADQIGFWYHWGDGDRSVMMIGGGEATAHVLFTGLEKLSVLF